MEIGEDRVGGVDEQGSAVTLSNQLLRQIVTNQGRVMRARSRRPKWGAPR
jgi:hypothetical protein